MALVSVVADGAVGARLLLAGLGIRLTVAADSVVFEMDNAAEAGRNRDTAATALAGKHATKDYDVFVSYSQRDKEWVRNWLLPKLEARGILPYVDFRDFEVGQPILTNIEHAVEMCPKTLLVLTPNWVTSEWAGFEGLLLQTRDPTNLKRRLVPLMLENCDVPENLAIFTYSDFRQPIYWDRSFLLPLSDA